MTIVPAKCGMQRKQLIALLLAAGLSLFLLGVGLGFGITQWQLSAERNGNDHLPIAPTKPVDIARGAVTAISDQCAIIGRDILRDDGSAVDSALAMLFCETVSTPQSMGLGGGFVGVVYTRATGHAQAIQAREAAPAAAHRDMFVNETRVEGIAAFAVPGELRGYGALHERYGRLPWRRLVQPSIDMCRNGFPVTPFLARVLATDEFVDRVRTTPEYRAVFWNESAGRLVRAGEKVRRERYGETLEVIAREGARTMYERNGTIAKRLIADVQELGGLVTMDDLLAYREKWTEPDGGRMLGDRQLYTSPLPASGSVLVFIMNMLDGYLPLSLGAETAAFYHRIVEAWKFAYAKRSDMGDPAFVPEAGELARNLTDGAYAKAFREQIDDGRTFNETEHYGASFAMAGDHGTAHVSVLAPNGDAVAITTTVNTYFGCKIISASTGIVLNDEMDDFSVPGRSNFFGLPASPANYIAPGKRPMSSMCPAIVVNATGDVEMVVGAAGGSKITTAVSLMMIRTLARNMSMTAAMLGPRLHHQLLPMHVTYEDGFDAGVLDGLRALGHGVEVASVDAGFGAVAGIARKGNHIEAVSDSRRNGSSALL